jgi:hypothetical protein
VVARLVELGLVDDAEFARAWLAGRWGRRPSGWRRLQQELRAKGIADEDIERARAQLAERGGAPDEVASAAKLVEQARRRYARLDPQKQRQRLTRSSPGTATVPTRSAARSTCATARERPGRVAAGPEHTRLPRLAPLSGRPREATGPDGRVAFPLSSVGSPPLAAPPPGPLPGRGRTIPETGCPRPARSRPVLNCAAPSSTSSCAMGTAEVPSSPLVPHGDPTLMFTTAGMVQFKPYYSATGDVPYSRATSVQKCLRLTDLENVGLTPRHDTFFEMLGNFSFGPRAKGAYFKEEAIHYAWEFVTEVLELPRERLFVSIFEGEGKLPRDEERPSLWKAWACAPTTSSPLGRRDNFWGPAGGAGACGPCSEIYFDLGSKRPDYLPKNAFWGEAPGDAGDRYMEFWNLVFPQFDAQADGTLKPLPNPGIDTGMGIERLALILQGKNTIFETDLFAPSWTPCSARRSSRIATAPRPRATHASSPITCARCRSRSPKERFPATRARVTCCAGCCGGPSPAVVPTRGWRSRARSWRMPASGPSNSSAGTIRNSCPARSHPARARA